MGKQITARRTAHIAGTALVLAATLVLSSCPWGGGSDFDDYDGVNLIAGQQFGATSTDTGAPWTLTPGLAAAENEDGIGGSGIDYARWELTPGTGAYTPPAEASGAPVYRFEVVNLFKNGGFEEGLAGWTGAGNGTPNAAIESGNPISGDQSLTLDFELPDTRYHIDLADPDVAIGLVDGFPVETAYTFHIDFRLDVDLFGLELNNGTVASTFQTWSAERTFVDPTAIFSYPGPDRANPALSATPNTIMRDPANPAFSLLSFGGINTASQGRIEGTFDNLRFVRREQAHYIRLPVTYRASGRPRIASGGVYTFSAWVKADPAAYDSSDPAFGNRFPARHLSVGLDRNPEENTKHDVVETIRQPLTEINESPGEWHQVSWEISGKGVQEPFGADSDYVVFDLVIEIGNAIAGPPYQDAGTVLLSTPSLTWQP